jgi:hypothetical protein
VGQGEWRRNNNSKKINESKKSTEHESTVGEVHHRPRVVPAIPVLAEELAGTYRNTFYLRCVYIEEDTLGLVEGPGKPYAHGNVMG